MRGKRFRSASESSRGCATSPSTVNFHVRESGGVAFQWWRTKKRSFGVMYVVRRSSGVSASGAYAFIWSRRRSGRGRPTAVEARATAPNPINVRRVNRVGSSLTGLIADIGQTLPREASCRSSTGRGALDPDVAHSTARNLRIAATPAAMFCSSVRPELARGFQEWSPSSIQTTRIAGERR